ncbi:hypothetical protein BC937DRAFT_89037 [Endogone sp. FLAS-F59071]|nr:hypothetical protein BC937DRAFT_89037 [Endogone sp. FLAS-F59071]|eukprot:RUS18210.1 hypothetical protein BC937DRAFT_89037 [Endogone sp. FLAS-F59071]
MTLINTVPHQAATQLEADPTAVEFALAPNTPVSNASKPVYIIKVGQIEKKVPAGKDVKLKNIQQLFSLEYQPIALTDIVHDITVFPSGDGQVISASDLEVGGVYTIVECTRDKVSGLDFDVGKRRLRVEIALWVSMAIYEEDPVRFLSDKRVINRHYLGEVCIGNGSDAIPYLVAFSHNEIHQGPKEVFIAIRGTMEQNHLLQNITAAPQLPEFNGMVHSGFLEQTEKIPTNFLTTLIEQHHVKRITLCGHSAGGSIAQLLLLSYLIRKGNYALRDDIDIIAISFGAPLIADVGTRSSFVDRPLWTNKFWSFMTNSDAVARSLNLVANIYGQRAAGSPTSVVLKAVELVKELGIAFSTFKAVDQGINEAKYWIESLVNDPWVTKAMNEVYEPIGLWIFCDKKGYNVEESTSAINERLGAIELTPQAIKDHGLDVYYDCLRRREVFDFSQTRDQQRIVVRAFPGDIDSSSIVDNIIVNRSQLFEPMVSSVRAQRMESANPKIVIEVLGANLEFTSTVQLAKYYDAASKPIELILSCIPGQEVNKTSNYLIVEGNLDVSEPFDNRFATLQIKTHFGSENFHIPDKRWLKPMESTLTEKFANDAVADMLFKAVQRCYISLKCDSKSTLGLLESIDQLERITLNQSKIMVTIERCCEANMSIEDGLLYLKIAALSICNNIREAIASDLEIKKPRGWLSLSLIVASGLIIGGAVGGIVAAGGVGATIGGGVGIVGTSAVDWIRFSSKQLHQKELGYRFLTRALLEQLKPVADKVKEDQYRSVSLNVPYLTEEALALKWSELGYDSLDVDVIVESDPFHSETDDGAFSRALPESVKEAVLRIKAIILLHDVRKKLLHNAYVTAVGPQNAGKTTALTKIFPGMLKLPNADTIARGLSHHTRHISQYEFENLTIVDFPGFNAVNETDTSAPDMKLSEKLRDTMIQSCAFASVILCIYPFEGSATTGLKQLVDAVKPYFAQIPIFICMNKASVHMNATDGLTDADALETWKARLITQLGLTKDEQANLALRFTDFEIENSDTKQRGILGPRGMRDNIVSSIYTQLSFVTNEEKIKSMLVAATNSA